MSRDWPGGELASQILDFMCRKMLRDLCSKRERIKDSVRVEEKNHVALGIQDDY